MKKNNSKKTNRKNKYFVVIADIENGKVTGYSNIVYMVANAAAGYDFVHNNYTCSVPAFVKSYNELVDAGVSPEKLNEFKNPVIY